MVQTIDIPAHRGQPEYWDALEIVRRRGVSNMHTPLFLFQEWDDDKINIQAEIDLETKKYKKVIIRINKAPEHAEGRIESLNPFVLSLLGDKKDTHTTVYEGNEWPDYFRPGRWQKHLTNIAEELRERSARFMDLNKKEVDDSDLFPDIVPDKTQ